MSSFEQNETTNTQRKNSNVFPQLHQKTFIYLLTFLSTIGGFLFGYDTGVVSGAMVLIKPQFSLTTEWHEAIVSVTILAAWISSFFGGYFADKYGRKPVILFASILFTAGSLIMCFANGREMLLIGRIIVGVGIGFDSMTVPMIIAECALPNFRGHMVTINTTLITAGQMIAAIVCGAFAHYHNGWRYMLGLPAIAAAFQFFAFLGMPESPRWLVSKKRYDDALRVLRTIRASNARVESELEIIKAAISEETPDLKGRSIYSHIVHTPTVLRAVVLGSLLQAFQQLAGINTVMYYSATIIQMAGVKDNTSAIWFACIPATVNFVCSFIGLELVDRIGRRSILIVSLIGTAISLTLLGLGFNLMDNHSPLIMDKGDCGEFRTCSQCISNSKCGFCYGDSIKASCWLLNTTIDLPFNGPCTQENSFTNFSINWCPTPYTWLVLTSLCLYLLTFAPGMGTMPWTINAEIYPTWARSTCNSVATSTNWMFNLFISMSFLSLANWITTPGVFYLYAGFSIIGLLIFFLYLPETKGKTLEEMEALFTEPMFSSCFRRKTVQYVHIRGLNRDYREDLKESDESDN